MRTISPARRQLAAHRAACEERLAALTKHRTILNARKKKRKPLYDALADAEALRPAMDLYAQGMTGMEDEAARYMDAVDVLEKSGVPLSSSKRKRLRHMRPWRKSIGISGRYESRSLCAMRSQRTSPR